MAIVYRLAQRAVSSVLLRVSLFENQPHPYPTLGGA